MPFCPRTMSLLLFAAPLLSGATCRLDEARQLFASAREASGQGGCHVARARVESALSLVDSCGEDAASFRDLAEGELPELLRLTGEPRKSLALNTSLLAQRESQLGPTHWRVGFVLDNMAKSLADLHRYYEAEPLSRRAIQIQEAARQPYLAAAAWNTLGTLFYHLDDAEGAIRQFRRGLAWLESDPEAPERASLLYNLGIAQMAAGEPAGARASFDEAYRLSTLNFSPRHPILTGLARARARLPKRLR